MDDELARIREKRRQELVDTMKKGGKAGSVSDISEEHFPQFISSNPFAVVDFWAEWCGPCRRVAPVMDELAKEFAGKVAFGKCNTDENRHIAMEFNISAIPAIMLFKNGQLADRIIGAYPKDAIREKIVRRFGLE
ncbi:MULTISPECIES: thioredoxin [unclassified Methanoregula]|uniref:thioredoxin n=1 Tax=unclassified Methanoregula TaxID=2649730 RepID=UPI0009D3430F|nr:MULTISPECIES: thioredoxin [unclassified Methanoregula]OPX64225.1 MAG: Thioredoxin [Methanoregula sp. PtaB.Bin085]OPY33651.1 MAG: Thioredoxin [Methanoregula sp. PtaU1.Bin006]